MRVTQHSGRMHRNGSAYSTKHNDRNFETEASNIDREKTAENITWTWCGKEYPEYSFDEAELLFYKTFYQKQLDATNKIYIQERHKDRVKKMDAWRKQRKHAPEEIIIQIGKVGDHPDLEKFKLCFAEYMACLNKWNSKHGNHMHILNWSLHQDEKGAPHVHIRRVWDYINPKTNRLEIGQEKALEAAGVQLPYPDQPAGRNNNRKMTFDAMMREQWQKIAIKNKLEIETEPLPKEEVGKPLDQVIAENEEKKKKLKEAIEQSEKTSKEAEAAMERAEKLEKEAREMMEKAEKLLAVVEEREKKINDDRLSIAAEKKELMKDKTALIEKNTELKMERAEVISQKNTYDTLVEAQRRKNEEADKMRAEAAKMRNEAEEKRRLLLEREMELDKRELSLKAKSEGLSEREKDVEEKTQVINECVRDYNKNTTEMEAARQSGIFSRLEAAAVKVVTGLTAMVNKYLRLWRKPFPELREEMSKAELSNCHTFEEWDKINRPSQKKNISKDYDFGY